MVFEACIGKNNSKTAFAKYRVTVRYICANINDNIPVANSAAAHSIQDGRWASRGSTKGLPIGGLILALILA